MSLLILALPPGMPAPAGSYAWATSVDGQTVTAHGHAAATLLPPAGRGMDVVAVVPATQLSWHRADLPRGIGPRSPRLRSTLIGLLEEQLLDDPEELHFALGPAATDGTSVWVAICRRDWLASHLQALDAAQRPVARIVPELAPQADGLEIVVTGEPDHASVLMSGLPPSGSVQALPLSASTLALLRSQSEGSRSAGVRSRAEPAVAALAERWLNQPVALVAPAQRLLEASHSLWDLAQFELARTGAARASRRVGAAWRELLHAPRWRPARWGLALLLLIQLAGLNARAWQVRDELDARRARIDATLTQAFPQVRVVVDAPVQMAREVAVLRQGTGAATPRDFEAMLGAVARIGPGTAPPGAIEFTNGELRLKGVQLTASALTDAQLALRPLGYRVDAEAGDVVVREGLAP